MDATSVRIGELVATADPGDVLTSVGLGSCIGVAIVDRSRRIAGLAHVMLPHSPKAPGPLLGRYANHAVPELLQRMLDLGARRIGMEVALVGGAQMFAGSTSIEVGRRNEAAVREALSALRCSVHAAATGGEKGRTVRVYPEGGIVTSRQISSDEVALLGRQMAVAR